MDCQRFVVNDNGTLKYGPLVAIFARDMLDSVFVPSDTVANNSFATNQLNGPLSVQAVATIVSWDSLAPDYEPLRLKLGVNCLYMRMDSQNRWTAFHQYNGMDGGCATSPRDAVENDTLEVYENPLPDGLTAADVPAVARWDWDERNQEHYLGIRCGNRYCEVGRRGFKPSPNIDPPEQFSSGQASRVFKVKGWYDRQILAGIKTEGGVTRLVPTGQMGIIVPWPTVDAIMNTDFPKSRPGKPVALLYVSGDAYDNDRKWNLKAGMPPEITNVMTAYTPDEATLKPMYGRVGRPFLGFIGEGGVVRQTLKGPWGMAVRVPFFFKVGTSHVTVTYRRHSGPAVDIPGTARWRWEATDETTWYRCPFGCCESN